MDTENNDTGKKPKKWLSAIFNRQNMTDAACIAVVSFAIKTTVLACTASIASPVIGLAIAAAAAGTASSYARHWMKNRREVKEGREPVSYTFKKAAIGAGVGLVGGAIGYGLSNLFHHFFPAGCLEKVAEVHTPVEAPVVVETPHVEAPAVVEVAAPVAEVPCTPVDVLREYAAHHAVSEDVSRLLARASSENQRVAAQAIKDLALMRLHGAPGMEKCVEEAVTLYKQAAAMGNLQAKVDLAWMEYHGNATAGIVANHDSAIDQMTEFSKDSPHAAKLVEQWTHPTTSAPAPAEVSVKISTEFNVETPPPAPEVAAPVVTTNASSLNCKGVIGVGTNNINLECTADGNDMTFSVGDRVIIQRPALLPALN